MRGMVGGGDKPPYRHFGVYIAVATWGSLIVDIVIFTITSHAPIMLLKLPIMLLSNASNFSLLCSNYARLCSIMSLKMNLLPFQSS